MTNNTVNGEKIGKAAGENDVTWLQFINFGNKSKEDKTIDVGGHNKTNPVIENLKKTNQVVRETETYVAFKALDGGNPNKSKKSEEITH